jgi:AbrB family looped-hinge helix DNA binding protein
MGEMTVRVDRSGRVVIPRELREALGIAEGGMLRLSVVDGELRGQTRLAALRRIQAKLRAMAPADGTAPSAVEELLAWRREEARRDLEEDEAR